MCAPALSLTVTLSVTLSVRHSQKRYFGKENTFAYFSSMYYDKQRALKSPRLSRTTSKGAFAYVYNKETLPFIQGFDYVYNDVNDVFES